jgi:glycerol-3-phosphate dehydrogenase
MNDYDIIIIGGGIQGVGCAQAAAAAGYSVCILEKDSWGAATSSHSSKLIHGGLRYLETYQFGLVRTSLHERRILLKIAPHLVHPLPFYIPVYRDSRHPPWMIFSGLSLYSLLGKFEPLARFRSVPKTEWPQLDGLKTTGLKKVYQYWDTQTDDHLLTLTVVKSAEKLGAKLMEHAVFLRARDNRDRYRISYTRQGEEKEMSCRVLINAGGPWAAKLQEQIGGAPAAPPIELVQGSHIELAGRISESIFYLESPIDRRAMFIMPWHENTLVGTTETAFSGDPASLRASDEEIDYLLAAVKHYFPLYKCRVTDSFAGLRVLPKGRAGFSARPRDTLVQYDNLHHPRLVSLYGGKLTTYRGTAVEIIDRLGRTLGKRSGQLDTAKISLAPADSAC